MSGTYVKFPLELLEAMMRTNWASYQLRVYLAILRKTIGWGVTEENISVGLLSKMTGLAKPNVSRALRELIGRRMIQRHGYRTRVIMNIDAWQSLPDECRRLSIRTNVHKDTPHVSADSGSVHMDDPLNVEETFLNKPKEKKGGAHMDDGCQEGWPEEMPDGYCEKCGKKSDELTDGICIVCYRKSIPSPPPQLQNILRVINCRGEKE